MNDLDAEGRPNPQMKANWLPGFQYCPDYLSPLAQRLLLDEVRLLIRRAPLFTPKMPRSGRPFSVQMTNCGALGWVSDKAGGYRYQPGHPETGEPWPPLPDAISKIWTAFAGDAAPPEACLVNYYGPEAKMGMHRDEDEKDFSAPVVSISLGDMARFRIGGLRRKDRTAAFDLRSGDVVVLGGGARLAYHGVDRIVPGSSDLLPEGGRFNLTLRRVTARN
ncbi:alpha-ketoglutarate-dependent dioxygenase AlkB [bacterium MnTg02]|nr:alpha-ketoglutarate-dependent dioxygenase AlkB [bacterium MnTg02]